RLEDFTHLLHESCEAAKKSLFETTAKLKALAKANVVDAGGKGFVLFLEGIIEYVKTGNIRQVLELKGQKELFEFPEEEVDITSLKYQYCSEALIKGDKLDKEKIREAVSSLGDSVIVAGSDTNLRLHIHTNEPAKLFEILRPFGTLAFQKADDMFRQYEVAHNRKYNIALVTDSACDIPAEISEKYQIHQVPLNLHIGDNNYLDKITIHPEQFYKILEETTEHPTTSQINEKAFVNMFSHLASHYDSIISIILSDPLSGTYRNSQSAARKISAEMNKTISTIDSRTLSGGIGLLVMKAARMIAEGESHWNIVKSIEDMKGKMRLFVSLKTMRNLVRSGRISPLKGWLARILNIKPVIFVNREGKIDMLEKSFGQQGTLTKILRHIRRLTKENVNLKYFVLHVNNLEGSRKFAGRLKEIIGNDPVAILEAAPVLGLHTGPGTLAVACLPVK
ncbi:MAG: DegV family EDD domain-containing protein, partial [Bacteroidales bacterium]|nr:DegV family EDD domain-containing protein [Bacteroidales bacterium]